VPGLISHGKSLGEWGFYMIRSRFIICFRTMVETIHLRGTSQLHTGVTAYDSPSLSRTDTLSLGFPQIPALVQALTII
jgi:hypothetical protein